MLRLFYAIFVVSENVTELRIKMYGEWLEYVDSFKSVLLYVVCFILCSYP